MNTKSKKSDSDKDSYRPLIILLVIVFIMWVIALLIMNSWDETKRGTFGDMFGSVNALFSGAALAGIIFTIFLQKKELGLQREELRETRQEFITQNETLRLQRFENTFFNLLSLHNEIIDNLYYKKKVRQTNYDAGNKFTQQFEEYTKRSYFFIAYGELQDIQNDLTKDFENIDLTEKAIYDNYQAFITFHGHLINHYFRNLYHIYKYIDKSDLIGDKQRMFYASIVRAQLSTVELGLIFYNSLIDGYGKPEFKQLVKKYYILKNMDDSYLFNEDHWNIFELK